MVNFFQGMWIGVLHHVVNVHSWILPYSVFLTVSQIKIYFCIDIHSKVILEQLLRSVYDANPSFNHVLF